MSSFRHPSRKTGAIVPLLLLPLLPGVLLVAGCAGDRAKGTAHHRALIGSGPEARKTSSKSTEQKDSKLPRKLENRPDERDPSSLNQVRWPRAFDQRVENRFRKHLKQRGWSSDSSSPDQRDDEDESRSSEP